MMNIQTINIEGMSCGHCVMAVRKELNKIDGVNIISINIGSAEIQTDETKVSDLQIRKAIEQSGYSVISVTKK